MKGTSQRFNDKVRFARDVEQCLLAPELPRSPLLLLRVRERVQLERVRGARRRELARLGALGAAGLALAMPGWIRIASGAVPWVGRLLRAEPVASAVRAYNLAATSPLQALLQLKGPGLIAVLSLLGLLLLLVLRDLYTDPLAGLPVRRSIR